MIEVIKRDGSTAEFNLEKISEAVAKAFKATGNEYTDDIIKLLSLRVTADFREKAEGGRIAVEDIQDSVEKVLEEAGYTEVAKAYILYRRQRERIRNMGSSALDYKSVVDSYVNVEDWRVKENSTVTYSVGGLILNNSGAVTANYWLTEIYDEETARAHRDGDIHLHDLSMLTGYSCGWSLKKLLLDGLGGITGKITAAPAKHLATLCNQMVNFLGIMQNEWAASQSFSSFDTYLAPFVKADSLSYGKVKKCIEAFVFGVNTPSRWGTQAPFSNISLDWTVPEDMAGQRAIVGGREMEFTYGDCQEEMDMLNRAFLETMLEGDAGGLGFQYPIPVYAVTEDFDWSETENNRLLFRLASKYGAPYFSNYINGGIDRGDVRRMQSSGDWDLHALKKKSGGFFGFGEYEGAVGVVTINLPRIAYQSRDEEEFFSRLDSLMDISARSLDTKRKVINKLMKNGLYPYTSCYLDNFDNHFSSIGIIGMNEAGRNAGWLQRGLEDQRVREFALRVIEHMKKRLVEYQLQYKAPYSLEATPAESATYRFAMADRERFPDIVTAGFPGDVPYYTNSTQLPVEYTDDLEKALGIQDEFQPLYTSGTVFHVLVEKEFPDWRKAMELVRSLAENHKMPYYTLSPSYSVCPVCGYLPGAGVQCPKCGGEAEVYSRIVGYYRPVRDWNEGKAQEFKNRKTYRL